MIAVSRSCSIQTLVCQRERVWERVWVTEWLSVLCVRARVCACVSVCVQACPHQRGAESKWIIKWKRLNTWGRWSLFVCAAHALCAHALGTRASYTNKTLSIKNKNQHPSSRRRPSRVTTPQWPPRSSRARSVRSLPVCSHGQHEERQQRVQRFFCVLK